MLLPLSWLCQMVCPHSKKRKYNRVTKNCNSTVMPWRDSLGIKEELIKIMHSFTCLRKLFPMALSPNLQTGFCSLGNVDDIHSCFPICGSAYLFAQILCPCLPLSYQIIAFGDWRETEIYVPSPSDPNSSNLLSSQERLHWAAHLQVTEPHS